MSDMSINNLFNWYVKGYYHCDKCPYSWEERGFEDADAGCYLFGELRDTCRHIRNPISQLIVNKHMNEADSRWDCWCEYTDVYELCHELYKETAEKQRQDWLPSGLSKFIESYDEYDGTRILVDIVEEYERKAHPYKTPLEALKESFLEWRKDFLYRHFKCYFRRK